MYSLRWLLPVLRCCHRYCSSVPGNNIAKGVDIMLFAPKEKGQGLVEYSLILVLVAIVVLAVMMLLGPLIGNVFSAINESLSTV